MADVTIDLISEEQGHVILWLRHAAPWDDREGVMEFQKRLNGYIDVVTQSVFYHNYPEFRHRPVRIRLICYHEPPALMRSKLDRVNQTLAGFGIGFEIKIIEIIQGGKTTGTCGK